MDVSKLDTRVKLFGQELPCPILLAPTGAQKFVHPEGELAAVRGAAAAKATYVISSSASMRVEDIAKAAGGPVWFQLYVQRDRRFTRDLVQQAEDAGCRALCVTVDSPIFGARNREDRAKGELPERELPNLKGKDYLDPTLTWKDIDWLRSFARRPVLLKGILNPDDAATAVSAGLIGHHRLEPRRENPDTVPATIEALPLVVERVAGRIPVLVDGGIRRGHGCAEGAGAGGGGGTDRAALSVGPRPRGGGWRGAGGGDLRHELELATKPSRKGPRASARHGLAIGGEPA